MNAIQRRRAIMAMQFPYVFVEYIEGDANSWIDTGIVPTNTFGYKVDLSMSDVTSDRTAFGTREDSGNTRVTSGVNNSYPYFGWGSIAGQNNTPKVSANTRYSVKCNYKNERNTRVNGTKVNTSSLPTLSFTPTKSFPLLGRNFSSGFLGVPQKLYEAEITSGSSVIRIFKPCYRISDGAIGLYDTIHGVFYGNSGSGTLTKGPDL